MNALHDFYISSVTNHNAYKRIDSKHKFFYTVEIAGFSNREDIVSRLQTESYKYKYLKWKTSISGEYIKTNGIITKQTELFETHKLILQQDISLKGYCLQEESVDVKEKKQWGDDDGSEDTGVSFTGQKEEFCHFFTDDDNFTIYLFDTKCVIKFKNTDCEFIAYVTNVFLDLIYINYPIIMTKTDEEKVMQSKLVNVLKETSTLFSFTYVSDKKRQESICIPNYFFTLPCIHFSLDGREFLLDTYNNLKHIGFKDVEPQQGFVDTNNHFISIDEEYTFHYDLERTSALVYKTDSGFQVYTKASNMYVDEFKNGFIRRNIMAEPISILNLFFTKKVMDKKRIDHIKDVLIIFDIKYTVKRFCNDLDIDYLLNMPNKKKEAILKNCEKMKNNWLASFFTSFLTIKYDETNPIVIELKPSYTNKVINYKPLLLQQKLESEKYKIDEFHNYRKNTGKFDYYVAVTKLLDVLKEYSTKEVQKRVYIKGSITNAWMKCWEMIHTFDLVPKNHSSDFTIFCNAEFPGAFILALNHYIKTETQNKKYEWFANSLWPENKKDGQEIFKDVFDLYKKYPQKWLMTAENGGSVLDPNMIDIIEKRLSGKVDLYTSDIGIGAEENEEEMEAPLNLGQILCGLKTLKDGGTLVCKMFLFFTPFNMSLLQVLANVFEKFYVTKPMASRGGNSEIYIVGKGYKKDQTIIDTLSNIALHWSKSTLNSYIEPVTEDFYVQLVYALYYIYERQISFLRKNMDCVEALYSKAPDVRQIFNKDKRQIRFTLSDTSEKDEFEFRKKIVDDWKFKFPVKYLTKEDDL